MRTPTALATLLMVVVATGSASAQRPERGERFAQDSASRTSIQGVAFVASAILPGAGQYYLKADRWVPFTALEAWAWLKYLDDRSRGRTLERAYRDLAWNVARRITTAARKDSVFTYYEAMSQYHSSGLFDVDPLAPGVQPELDSTTFNGTQWRRARALFLRGGLPALPGTPEYEQALAFYRTNAIPDDYIWSWGTSRLEREEFQETIARSDGAFRSATRMLGVILANHIVSAVDALVLARVRLLSENGVRIGTTIEPGRTSHLWTAAVHIPIGGAERASHTRTDR